MARNEEDELELDDIEEEDEDDDIEERTTNTIVVEYAGEDHKVVEKQDLLTFLTLLEDDEPITITKKNLTDAEIRELPELELE